jgi:hypothetical protein
VVEGVFGAIKTRIAGGYLQEMLPSMAQKRAYLEAVVRGLAAAAVRLNGLVTTLASQPSIRPLQPLLCKTSPPVGSHSIRR